MIRTRLLNHEVTELLHRLGIHNWRLSEPERAYLHRFVYLSLVRGFETLGLKVEEQDPLLPYDIIRPPLFDRVPPMPPVIQPSDILDTTDVIRTNGH
jgi:hypothetical protein